MSVTEYKVKLLDIFRKAKITDSIFKRHIFISGVDAQNAQKSHQKAVLFILFNTYWVLTDK